MQETPYIDEIAVARDQLVDDVAKAVREILEELAIFSYSDDKVTVSFALVAAAEEKQPSRWRRTYAGAQSSTVSVGITLESLRSRIRTAITPAMLLIFAAIVRKSGKPLPPPLERINELASELADDVASLINSKSVERISEAKVNPPVVSPDAGILDAQDAAESIASPLEERVDTVTDLAKRRAEKTASDFESELATDSGFTYKRWVTRKDGRVRDSHMSSRDGPSPSARRS